MSGQSLPSGLRTAGKRLWSAVAESFVLNPGELANLAEACRTADELDRLEKAVRALPDLVVSGSTGQPKVHPLWAEARAHRLLLERLVGGLNLPDADEEVRHASGPEACADGCAGAVEGPCA